MKYETWIKIDNASEFIFKVHIYLITVIGALIASPFILFYEGFKYVRRKVKGMVYDPVLKDWITKEKMEVNIRRSKIKAREIPLDTENHVPVDKNGDFFFFEKRQLKIPYDQLVYVETEYNEDIHAFFADNTEWLDTWQRWHGWDIAEYDAEDIKEGMFYPQDYAVFKHGFLWRSPLSSWDRESDVFGNQHHYFEIEPDSEISIKDQMDRMMRKIYGVLDHY